MANIARFDPFFDVDDLFRDFRLAPVHRNGDAPQMNVDVEEDEKSYSIHAEIPSVKKEDIKVTVDGNQISIGAEVKLETEKKEKGRVVHSERYYGNVFRSFSLDSAVDETKGSAKYNDGVLDLDLPKKSEGGPTKLPVS